MKKLITAVALAAMLAPSAAFATGNHPMAGCGLGYLLLSNKDNDKVTQIIGSISNWSFGTQIFGVSSGTSGCTQDGAVKLARSTEVFAEVNLDAQRHDIAAGQGEYVTAFASLLGTTDTHRPMMISLLQSEYVTLFPTSETSSTDMLQHLTQVLTQHSELSS